MSAAAAMAADLCVLPAGAAYGAAALLGAILGSFANVLIHRLPRNLSVVGPRSRCPACGITIAWYDNVPVLSWLVLRARCRHCGMSIPLRYLLVELAGAACGIVAVARFGMGPAALSALLLLIVLLAVALVDWEHMIIPHTLTLGGAVAGFLLSPWNGLGLGSALLGATLGAGTVLALAQSWRLVRGQVGMGGGDVMLMGLVGCFLGPRGVLLVLFGGALLGTLYAMIRYGYHLKGNMRLPFGTFLAAAGALALVAGDPLVRWYLSLLS
jgi:leader peptidase (prepilin peptidase)/N-methyltransferase